MEITTLTIPIYDWGVTIFTNVSTPKDIESVKSQLKDQSVDLNVLNELINNLDNYNLGNHLCNQDKQLAYLIFTQMYNELGFWKIVPHELNHLIDRISETHGLDIEARGYLSGFINSTLYQLGVFDYLKDYAEPPQGGIAIPSLDISELLLITDDDLTGEATLDTLLSCIKSTDKINLQSVYNASVVVYNGYLGFKIIKDRYGYSEEYIKSYLSENYDRFK